MDLKDIEKAVTAIFDCIKRLHLPDDTLSTGISFSSREVKITYYIDGCREYESLVSGELIDEPEGVELYKWYIDENAVNTVEVIIKALDSQISELLLERSQFNKVLCRFLH